MALIPNRGPLRRRTTTKKWIGKAITRPGKLGGAGFLSKSKAAQEKILRGCVAEYGYRSCLGSVMILERIPDIQARWGARLAGLRHFLVRNFGGPGSFGPRQNPTDFALVPEVSGCPACMVRTNPKWEKEMAGAAALGAGAGALLAGPLGAAAGGYAGSRLAKDAKKKASRKKENAAAMRRAMRGT